MQSHGIAFLERVFNLTDFKTFCFQAIYIYIAILAITVSLVDSEGSHKFSS